MRPKDPGKTARMRRELREELKGKKTVVTIYIILRVLVILTMVAQFLNGNFENVFLCILTLVLFTLPTVIERRVRIDLPDTLEIIILVFIFASEILGELGCFFINVPIAIIMIGLTVLFIPTTQATQAKRLDLIGALTSIIGMTALVYRLVGQQGRLLALLVAVVAIAAFIWQEARTKQPMMPLRLFADRERLGGYIARFFYLGAMLSMWFLTPQIMQTHLGFTPLQAGIGFFPLTVVNFIVALQVSKLTTRFGNTKLLTVGIATTAIGMCALGFFSEQVGYALGIAVPMILMGIGQGLTLSPLTVAGVANTLPADAGAASGVVNMVHQIGGSIGMSFIVAVSATFKNGLTSYHVAMGLATVLLIGALLAVIGLILPTLKKES